MNQQTRLPTSIRTPFTGIEIPEHLNLDTKCLCLKDSHNLSHFLFNINYAYFDQLQTTFITDYKAVKSACGTVYTVFQVPACEIERVDTSITKQTLFFYPKDARVKKVTRDTSLNARYKYLPYMNYININHSLFKYNSKYPIDCFIGVVTGDNLLAELNFQIAAIRKLNCKEAFIFIINHTVNACNYNDIIDFVKEISYLKIFILSSKPLHALKEEAITPTVSNMIADVPSCKERLCAEQVTFIKINPTINPEQDIHTLAIYTYLTITEFLTLKG